MPRNEGRGRARLTLVGHDAELAFYARQVAQHASSRGPVLVLGCASGRVAFELATHGHPVVGVDPSTRMIELAEETRSRQAPELADRVKLLTADLRSLRLPQRFGIVLAPQNAAGLMASLDDLDALVATAREHLGPDSRGIFVLDVAHPVAPHAGAVEPGEALPPEPTRPLFAPHLRERRRGPDMDQRAIRRLRLRQFEPAELDEALQGGGFTPLQRFGGFDGKPFDPLDPVQIVVAALD